MKIDILKYESAKMLVKNYSKKFSYIYLIRIIIIYIVFIAYNAPAKADSSEIAITNKFYECTGVFNSSRHGYVKFIGKKISINNIYFYISEDSMAQYELIVDFGKWKSEMRRRFNLFDIDPDSIKTFSSASLITDKTDASNPLSSNPAKIFGIEFSCNGNPCIEAIQDDRSQIGSGMTLKELYKEGSIYACSSKQANELKELLTKIVKESLQK